MNKLFLIVHIYGRTFSFLPHSYFSLFLKIFATAGDKSQGGTHVYMIQPSGRKGLLFVVDVLQGKNLSMILRQNL